MRWVEKRRDEKGLDVRWDAPGGITSNRWAEIRWDETSWQKGEWQWNAMRRVWRCCTARWDEMRWAQSLYIIMGYIYIHHIMIHIMIYSIPIIIYYHAQEWKLERLKICEPQSSAWPHPIGVSIFVPLYRRFMAFQFWNFRPRLARVLLVWTQHIYIYIYICTHICLFICILIYIYIDETNRFLWYENNIIILKPTYFLWIHIFRASKNSTAPPCRSDLSWYPQKVNQIYNGLF